MSEQRTCNSCGAPVSADEKYCTSCGNRLQSAVAPEKADVDRTPESNHKQPMKYGSAPQKNDSVTTERAKKKSALPIPIVAVILIAAVTVVGVFFLLRGGSGNDEKIWREAEESLLDKSTALGAFHAFSVKHLDAQKTGIVSEISFNVQSIPGFDSASGINAEIFRLLNNLVVRMENLSVYDKDESDFSFKIDLSTRDSDTSHASISMYTVDEKIFLTFPELFPKSILIGAESSDEWMSIFNFSGSGSLPGIPGNSLDAFRDSGQSLSYLDLEKSIADIREIYYKFAEVPTRKKNVILEVGSVSETVDCFEAVVPEDVFPEFILEVIAYIRDDQNFYHFIEKMMVSDDPGAEPFTSDDYQSILNEMIEKINLDREFARAEFRSIIYLSDKNKVRGREWVLDSQAKDDFLKSFVCSELRAGNGGENAYSWSLTTNKGTDSTVLYALDSLYTEKGGKKTGSYTVRFHTGDGEQTQIKGTFADYSLFTKNDSFYPEGRVTADEISTSVGESVTNSGFSYEGTVENKSGADHLLSTIHLYFVNDMGEVLDMAIETDFFFMDPSVVKIISIMPSDYVKLDDDAAMDAMYAEGESLLINLITILESLGFDTTATN